MSLDKIKNVGLIISTNSLTAVEVESGKKAPLVTNYSKVSLDEGIVEDGCIVLNPEGFEQALRKLLSSGVGGAIHAKEVLIALPEEKIFSHRLTIPKEKMKDEEMITEIARDFIPIELSEATYDYKIDRESAEDKTVTINFVAAQSSIIEPIIDILKKVKLTVVGIGIDINCLIRSFDNSLNSTEGDFLLVNMDMERDLLATKTDGGHIEKILLKEDRKSQIEKIKALFNLPSSNEVNALLLKAKKGEAIPEAQKEDLKRALSAYLGELDQKINQLVTIAGQKDTIDLKTVYLTGIFSGLPGIREMLEAKFPQAAIKTKLDYVEIPDEIENDALEGIGLCVKESIKSQKNNFNLLPEVKKDEISIAKVTPKLKIYSVIATGLLIALVGKLGIDSAGNYLNYRLTSREVVIVNEQTLNPYIADVAQRKQQTQKVQNQVLSVIEDSLPVSRIIDEIQTYNKNGITLVNLKYSDQETEGTAQVSMRAKAVSRTETEKFVSELENKDIYSLVVSPLSNLLGKGERFINLTLMLDKPYIISQYEEEQASLRAAAPEEAGATEVTAPKTPSTPADATQEESKAAAPTETAGDETVVDETAPATETVTPENTDQSTLTEDTTSNE